MKAIATLFLLCICSFGASWTSGIPTMSARAYRGPHGWHDTIADGKVDISRTEINEALRICEVKKWAGYVVWQSAIGRETDGCEFLHWVVMGEVKSARGVKP